MDDNVLIQQPTNRNFLSPLRFQFAVERLKNTNYFVDAVNIPGLTLGMSDVSTPLNKYPLAGTEISWDDLTVNFKVDENLQNWIEIYNWMIGLGEAKNTENYRLLRRRPVNDISTGVRGINVVASDATLLILDCNNQKSVHIRFIDCIPSSLTGIQLSSTIGELSYATSAVTFKYTSFDFVDEIETT